MSRLEELLNQAFEASLNDLQTVTHEHLSTVAMFSTDPPLSCGSQYFVRLNDFTLGFERDELIRFRDEVNEGVAKSLARHGTDVPVSQIEHTCITCGASVKDEDGFNTSVGWMHFDCRKEVSSADSQSATPGA